VLAPAVPALVAPPATIVPRAGAAGPSTYYQEQTPTPAQPRDQGGATNGDATKQPSLMKPEAKDPEAPEKNNKPEPVDPERETAT
jgi:hypothetical protein